MHHMQCEYCGYEDYFEVEEDTMQLYCIHCGHYVITKVEVLE